MPYPANGPIAISSAALVERSCANRRPIDLLETAAAARFACGTYRLHPWTRISVSRLIPPSRCIVTSAFPPSASAFLVDIKSMNINENLVLPIKLCSLFDDIGVRRPLGILSLGIWWSMGKSTSNPLNRHHRQRFSIFLQAQLNNISSPVFAPVIFRGNNAHCTSHEAFNQTGQ